jgi:DNA polymerase-2
MVRDHKAFIFSEEWNDTSSGGRLRLYGRSPTLGPVCLEWGDVRPVFFVDRKASSRNSALFSDRSFIHRKDVDLRALDGRPVDALYFRRLSDSREMWRKLSEQGIQSFEADIRPEHRFRMERFINSCVSIRGTCSDEKDYRRFYSPAIASLDSWPGEVSLSSMSLDIETNERTGEIYSIGMYQHSVSEKLGEVLMQGDGADLQQDGFTLRYCGSEKELLKEFFTKMSEWNPDLIIGWNIVGFDLSTIARRCELHGLALSIGRDSRSARVSSGDGGRAFAHVPGRVVLDGPQILRSSFISFDSYSLENVAWEVLGTGKRITQDKDTIEEVIRLFADDPVELARYNFQDCVLVAEIFQSLGLYSLLYARSMLSGMLLDRLSSSTGAFDHLYLPKLHRQGYVAANREDVKPSEHAAGGHVFEPEAGIHKNIVVLDFKSLYPTIIRTFGIDPLALAIAKRNPKGEVGNIRTPSGHSFDASQAILPSIIESLLIERALAKKAKNKNLSQALKILMNSFYGVLGSFGCRFYHPDLPRAITGSGQWILRESKDYLQGLGYRVVYGDTDSVFVAGADDNSRSLAEVGAELAGKLNSHWKERMMAEFGVESFLELEVDRCFRTLLLPAARSGDGGAKKRYAGVLENGDTPDFVGMEFVRSDWTMLAKEFQFELYEMILGQSDCDVAVIKTWLRKRLSEIREGRFDAKLIYRKRLRKPLEDYTKTAPPQVKAARQLPPLAGGRNRKFVEYVMCKRGPVPIELEHRDIDYEHYIKKQLRPIADSILPFLDTSFDRLVEIEQLNLFS